MSYTERALGDIQRSIGSIESNVEHLKDDFGEIKKQTAKNTDQISEIRRSLSQDDPGQSPHLTVAEIIKKLWPMLLVLLVGVAIGAAIIADKFDVTF